jgi:hypothetical protein
LRSKASFSGGSAKLVANVILQNQEKKRNNEWLFAIAISSSCNKCLKKNPKTDNGDERVICPNCCSSCNKYNSKKGKKQR